MIGFFLPLSIALFVILPFFNFYFSNLDRAIYKATFYINFTFAFIMYSNYWTRRHVPPGGGSPEGFT